MTIGPITPASALLADTVPGAPGVPGDPGAGALFTSLLDAELQAVGDRMAGAAATQGRRIGAAATTVPPATATSTAASPATASSATASPATATSTAASPATAGQTATRHPAEGFTVSYAHGATPVSTGSTRAPLVKGATGQLVLTARTTGLTQLTTHFTGTVADPTAAARATAAVMAQIAGLVAGGQA